jgi:hypothetical protein
MDSLSNDLRDALNEVLPEANLASSAVAEQRSSARGLACSSCGSSPGLTNKLRYCGRCGAKSYCSKPCAEEDWAKHKAVCESMRRDHDIQLAEQEAQVGRK